MSAAAAASQRFGRDWVSPTPRRRRLLDGIQLEAHIAERLIPTCAILPETSAHDMGEEGRSSGFSLVEQRRRFVENRVRCLDWGGAVEGMHTTQ